MGMEGKKGSRKRKQRPPRPSDDSSDDEPPRQLPRRNPHSSPHRESGRNLQHPLVPTPDITGSDHHILPGGSGQSSKKPSFFISDILGNLPENPQQCESESRSLPSNYEESHSSDQQSVLENPSENDLVIEKPMETDTSASDPNDDLISFRNLELSLCVIPNTDNLQQDQPNLSDNSVASSRKKSSFVPSYIFRNLLHAPNTKEVENVACEWTIFQPNSPTDVLPEDASIFRDLKNVFASEGKVQDSTGQTEILGMHETADNEASQNLFDQDKQNCYDWDKFLERWESADLISTREHSLPSSSTSKSKKRKKTGSSPSFPFNGQAKKRPCVAESSETIASSSKSISSDEEHSSNQKVLPPPPFENDTEYVVRSIPSDISDSNTSSKLEKFIKNTKIKLLEDEEVPPCVEKLISHDLEFFPNRTEGSPVSNDSFEILQEETKNIFNLLRNRFCVGENMSSSINDSDKIEELTVADENPSDAAVVDDDAETIS